MVSVRMFLLILLLTPAAVFAQVQLRIGSLTLSESGHPDNFCVQIPIFLHDVSLDGRAYVTMSFTVAFSGDTSIINGNVTTPMLVAGGFTNLDGGIRNPAIDLENVNPMTDPSPTCTVIHNQATEGYPQVDYLPANSPSVFWSLNNNGEDMGYKTGFMIDFNLTAAGYSQQGVDQLLAVLEIPIIANPGGAVLTISAVPNTTLPDANIFDYSPGNGGPIASEDFDLSQGVGNLRFCPQTLASQPQDVVACPGDDVEFSVEVTGAGPFSYQWYRDNVALAGQEANSLMLTNIDFPDLGAYHCSISSVCATVETTTAELNIGDLDVSISPPGLGIGLSIPILSASASCAVGMATYEWHDSSGALVGDEASLELNPVPLGNEAYTLTVVDGGARTIEQTVNVLVSPLGPDLNGDGFNTLDDLFLVLPSWRSMDYDVNDDGVLNVLDLPYINTGQ